MIKEWQSEKIGKKIDTECVLLVVAEHHTRIDINIWLGGFSMFVVYTSYLNSKNISSFRFLYSSSSIFISYLSKIAV